LCLRATNINVMKLVLSKNRKIDIYVNNWV
jgi:hypothetical protein